MPPVAKKCDAMDIRKQARISIREVKEMDLVDYLSNLGIQPAKIKGVDYWYLSPFRNEKTASFKVNRKINRWYDHGLGKGGNLIDFGILYNDCSVAEFLQELNGNFFFHQQAFHKSESIKTESKIKILQEGSIHSFALLRYFEQRKIPIDIAEQFCKEVRYELSRKIYYGIGFKNDSGGYEIRNPFFKTSSSPKNITTIKNEGKEIAVFEGFFDFLSFMTVHKNQEKNKSDFIILNSVSFFETARLFMEKHETVRLYLDRDVTGQNYSRYALSLSKKYRDESILYKHYKDLNDWLINFGKSQKKNLNQKL